MDWNDWFQWRTLYYAYYFDMEGDRHDIGAVKFALLGHEYSNDPAYATPVPDEFDVLGEAFVSVGQDESYYANLAQAVGAKSARSILSSLRDLAVDPERLDSIRSHAVVSRSLLRSVSEVTVKTTFSRLANGLGRSQYEFQYLRPASNPLSDPVEIDFAVFPDSKPPTNVHVLIGRNGAGKSTHLRSMALAMLGPEAGETTASFREKSTGLMNIANLVYVSFSAFDDAVLPVLDDEERFNVRYSYVGLLAPVSGKDARLMTNEPTQESLAAARRTLAPSDLADAFASSAWIVVREKSRALWREALQSLESDPIFADADVSRLADVDPIGSDLDFKANAATLYRQLSSGHKIVLLAVTRLVQTVTERSLVLIDEPEGHLHPPLLSAFVRTLSSLMKSRNGVAIVATHSPVVLQEVPRSCAWRVSRTGDASSVEPLPIETFGENIGVLTSSIFGLEVSDSGFHKLLIEAAMDFRDYKSVIDHFDGHVGSDARAVLAAWFADAGFELPSHASRRSWGQSE